MAIDVRKILLIAAIVGVIALAAIYFLSPALLVQLQTVPSRLVAAVNTPEGLTGISVAGVSLLGILYKVINWFRDKLSQANEAKEKSENALHDTINNIQGQYDNLQDKYKELEGEKNVLVGRVEGMEKATEQLDLSAKLTETQNLLLKQKDDYIKLQEDLAKVVQDTKDAVEGREAAELTLKMERNGGATSSNPKRTD